MKTITSFRPDTMFRCLECEDCCRSDVAMTEHDIAGLGSQFTVRQPSGSFKYRLVTREDRCPYLSPGKGCRIYESRPLMCRLYPMHLNAKWNGTPILCLVHCPGIDRSDGEPIGAAFAPTIRELIDDCEGGFMTQFTKEIIAFKGKTTPVFFEDQIVAGDWLVRDRIWELIWQNAESIRTTPRRVMRCVYADMIPAIKSTLVPDKRIITVQDLDRMREELRSRDVVNQAAEIERALDEDEARCTADRSAMIHYVQSDEISIEVSKGRTRKISVRDVMRPRSITAEARRKEMDYLEEIVKRECKYGRFIMSGMPVDLEALILFEAADMIEVNANVFAFEERRDYLSSSDMVKAITIVDRHMERFAGTAMDRMRNKSLIRPLNICLSSCQN